MAVTRQRHPWTDLLDEGRADERLVREAFEGGSPARLVEPPPLHPKLLGALRDRGVDQLYTHQAEAAHAAMEGPFIVTTGTASGKSLCFNLPTLHALLAKPTARALYLYPTKALAQDQARALNALGLTRQIRPAIYDGDTPREQRRAIRERANVVLTNPDMLHVGILPNHRRYWDRFLAQLEVVVVDEAHVYRGVFGCHVANVLRRLRRLAPGVRIYLASATVANPVELAERLTGLDGVALVDSDGSPQPKRQIAMWNPPVTDEATAARRSSLGEAADLLVELLRGGARTICFVKSRRGVELLSKIVADSAPELADVVAPYRAGYTPQQRRDIEARLVSGDLKCVVTTDALELGIDIGALDACVVVTFPGTVASLRQMWGRAGRRGNGLAVYVAGEDALDQFFCRHPEQFLERPVEAAILDHRNPDIFRAQLLCAAHEAPLGPRDDEVFGPEWRREAETLVAAGLLVERRGHFVLRHPEDYPAARVSLRSASPDSFAVVETSSGELLGTVEAARAFTTVHDGAIYLHQARSYEVEHLDVEGRRALVHSFNGQWYTQPKKETDTWVERVLEKRSTMGVDLSFGMVAVSETVMAYQRKRLPDHEVIDLQALDLPTTEFSTQALWWELPDDMLDEFPSEALLGALHAAEHTQIAVLPLLAMCDRWDIGGLSTNMHPQTGRPTVFIYDGHPGGVGITRRGYEVFETLVADAYRLIDECPCQSGCPSCVQSPKCGNLNEPLHKAGALEVLARMLHRG